MLEAFFVTALLSVTDPPGDAGSDLSAPTAAVFRQHGAFDIRSVAVEDTPTLTLEVTLESFARGFPEVLLEFYLQDPEVPGTAALLPGSTLALPTGASWRYAVRVVGEHVRVFGGSSGAPVDLTEASGAELSVSGNTLTVITQLPVLERFSLYGMSGSYDPFSTSGWRELRETPSPWGFAGGSSPVLDVVSDDPAGQDRALARGVLPEIRASVSQPGWLLVAGAGALLAAGGFVARLTWGRERSEVTPSAFLPPLTEREVRRRARLLRALAEGRGRLEPLTVLQLEAETPPPEPVLS